MNRHLIVDNFAGGGGASTGIEAALGRPVDIAINHNAAALAIHAANHPETEHLCEDVFAVRPREACKGRPVALAWFSPDCKHFSKAKGGRPVDKRIRGLAWVAVRWAREVRPSVIVLENVEEFRTWGPLLPDGKPDPARRGMTYRRFVSTLRNLGYVVEDRELVAADYGAPTIRKRLFLIARCDGRPIVWPEPTHARDPESGDLFESRRAPWRSAAECIDWSIACPSIFMGKDEARRLGIKRPLEEKTLRRIHAGLMRFVVNCDDPFIVSITHAGGERAYPISDPLRTITSAHRGELALVTPFVAGVGGRAGQSRPRGAHEPTATITAKGDCALIAAFLNKYRGASEGAALRSPMPTITSGAGSIRPAGAAHALGITTAHLCKLYGTSTGADVREPMHTITGGGQHIAEVRAFLISYYGQGVGQSLRDPARTITTRDRLGLVTIHGVDWQIVDIGLRMLTPRELALAQGFPADYILPKTKSAAVAMIGNSVCPPVAEAIIRANGLADYFTEEMAA